MVSSRPSRLRNVTRQGAAGDVHLGHQPAAEDVAVRVGVGRHRQDPDRRIAGRLQGR